MLTRQTVGPQVPIPHEDGQWMQFRRLSWTEIEEAEAVKSKKFLESTATDPKVQASIAKTISPEDMSKLVAAAIERAKANPFQSCDRATVLRYGIVAWSYGVDVTEANVSDLDKMTAKWAEEQIADVSGLGAQAEKNGTSGSGAV